LFFPCQQELLRWNEDATMPEWMVTRPFVAAHPALEEKQTLKPGEV